MLGGSCQSSSYRVGKQTILFRVCLARRKSVSYFRTSSTQEPRSRAARSRFYTIFISFWILESSGKGGDFVNDLIPFSAHMLEKDVPSKIFVEMKKPVFRSLYFNDYLTSPCCLKISIWYFISILLNHLINGPKILPKGLIHHL